MAFLQGIDNPTYQANPTTVLQFFTQFVNPTNANYSWNRGQTDSKTAFLAGNLATYFGFASELSGIRSKNPNLNFDVAQLPQVRSGGIKAVYARMYGLSIVRSTANANGVYQVLSILTDPTNLAKLAATMYLPPIRSDLIAQGSSDPYVSIFDQAALVSKTWLDADPVQSNQIFGSMIDSITSGQSSIYQALGDGSSQYNVVLQQATGQ